jgi:hypothetical protein
MLEVERPFGELHCALTPLVATTKRSRAINLIRILNFDRFKNLNGTQDIYAIVIKQPLNNEYDAKKLPGLVRTVLIITINFFSVRPRFCPENILMSRPKISLQVFR